MNIIKITLLKYISKKEKHETLIKYLIEEYNYFPISEINYDDLFTKKQLLNFEPQFLIKN